MVTTKQLRELNAIRDNLGRFFLGLILVPLAIAIGIILVVNGIKEKELTVAVLGLAAVAFGIFVCRKTFGRAFRTLNKVYKLFEENDVFVEPPAWRRTEKIALDQFNGELKPALRYIVETPDFYRDQRRGYIGEWFDYESVYIRDYYKKDPMLVAESSRTYTLTRQKIESEGVKLGVDASGQCDYEFTKATCCYKHRHIQETDDDTYSLEFWDYGSCDCSGGLYNHTVVGEEFYIIKGTASGRVHLAYSTLDFHLDDDLIELLQ